MQLKETFERVKRASKTLALLSDKQRNDILLAVANTPVSDVNVPFIAPDC